MDGRTLRAPCPASSSQSLCGIRRDREGGGGGDGDGDGLGQQLPVGIDRVTQVR